MNSPLSESNNNNNNSNNNDNTTKQNKTCLEFSYDNYSNEEYCEIVWPALEQVLNTFLNYKTGQYVPIKYEEMYCHIYKCVCKDYRERLYNDLISYVTNHVMKLSHELELLYEQNKQNQVTSLDYIYKFNESMEHYQNACKAIVAIFHYLNINYVKPKLRSDLSDELTIIIINCLIDKHINAILLIVNDIDELNSSYIQIEKIENLIDVIYKLKSDYSKLNQNLFHKYSRTFRDYNCFLMNNNEQDINTKHQIHQQQQQLDINLNNNNQIDFHAQQQQQQQLNQIDNANRKRHADDTSIEPLSKMFC